MIKQNKVQIKQDIIFVEETEQNELMSKKNKMVCTILNYIDYFLILVSVVTGCILISVFAFLFGILAEITSSVIGLQIFALITGIKKKKYKSIIKKKKKKHDSMELMAKSKLNSTEILISKDLIDSSTIHGEFF